MLGYRKLGFIKQASRAMRSTVWNARKAHTHHVELNLALHRAEKDIFAVATEELKKGVEAMCAKIVKEAHQTKVLFMPKSEARQKYSYVPDFLPEDKPVRIVASGDTFGVSCGGTHVKNSGECGSIKIRKIKLNKDRIKISYCC